MKVFILATALILAACGGQQAATPVAVPVPDSDLTDQQLCEAFVEHLQSANPTTDDVAYELGYMGRFADPRPNFEAAYTAYIDALTAADDAATEAAPSILPATPIDVTSIVALADCVQ